MENQVRATIHDLAPEILGSIFQKCLPVNDKKCNIDYDPDEDPDDEDPGPPTVSLSSYPLLLTTVSRHWRFVAQSTPRLWSRIHVVLGPIDGAHLTPLDSFTNFQNRLEGKGAAIVRWLTHAGASKIEISFNIKNQGLNSVSFYLRNKIFRTVLGVLDEICSSRFTNNWKSLTIHDIDEPYRSRFLHIPSEDLQSLQRLSYMDSNYSSIRSYPAEDEYTRNLRRNFQNSTVVAAPSLTSLHLVNPRLAEKQVKDLPLANWSGLTELTLNGGYLRRDLGRVPFEAKEIFTILTRCAPALQVLNVTIGVYADSWAFEPRDTLTLSCLRKLHIYEQAPDSGASSHSYNLLSALRTPALSELQFDAGCLPEQGESSLLAFAQVNASNLSNLTSLTFEYNYLGPDELGDFLAIVGTPGIQVRSLDMIGGDVAYRDMGFCDPPFAIFWSRVLERFNPEVESPSSKKLPLFLKLEEFTCHLVREDEFDDQDLLEFLRHRLPLSRSPLAELKKVHIDFVSGKTIDVEEKLEDLGLDISKLKLEIKYDAECRWANI